jgi:hypothetical protein
MKKAIVLIKDVDQQYEGLRTSLGLLLEDTEVTMVVLHHPIAVMDEAYQDNMDFLDEMEGRRFSNNTINVETHGFQYATMAEIAEKINKADVVIPF